MRGPARVRHRRAIRWSLVVLLVVNWIAYDVSGSPAASLWASALPMQLCDWATVTVVVALLTDGQTWYELSYFWGLAGNIPGDPDAESAGQFSRFAFHQLLRGALRDRHRGAVPDFRGAAAAPARIDPADDGLVGDCISGRPWPVNYLTGDNYGFLTHRPAGASLLDYFSNNHILYLLEMNVLALVFFVLLYGPFGSTTFSRARGEVDR